MKIALSTFNALHENWADSAVVITKVRFDYARLTFEKVFKFPINCKLRKWMIGEINL